MDTEEKELFFKKYNERLHILGRGMLIGLVIIMVATPFIFGLILGAMPDMGGFFNGVTRVMIIYVPVAVVEFLVYAPMLGVGGTYITFITGNVINLKIPCIMNARDIAQTKAGTIEDEVISTISSATSALVTMGIIFIGVLLLVPLTPILQSPILEPAFDTVVPALFGALGFKYIKKSPKIAIIPFGLMIILCLVVPSVIEQTSLLLLPSGGLALLIGFILYKKGKL